MWSVSFCGVLENEAEGCARLTQLKESVESVIRKARVCLESEKGTIKTRGPSFSLQTCLSVLIARIHLHPRQEHYADYIFLIMGSRWGALCVFCVQLACAIKEKPGEVLKKPCFPLLNHLPRTEIGSLSLSCEHIVNSTRFQWLVPNPMGTQMALVKLNGS